MNIGTSASYPRKAQLLACTLLLLHQNHVESLSPPLPATTVARTTSFTTSFNGEGRPMTKGFPLYAFQRDPADLNPRPAPDVAFQPTSSTKLEAATVGEDVEALTEIGSTPAAESPYNKQSTVFGGDVATDKQSEYQRGLLICGLITIVFASNSPALHAAFSATDSPPPVLLVNAAVGLIALLGIFAGGPLVEATTPPPSSLVRNQQANAEKADPYLALRGGFEIGLWKFLGMTANIYGLSLTTADHAAFLIQLTTLVVPVIQGIMGVPISKRIWASVALALSGVYMFTQEGGASVDMASNAMLGDALCVLASGFYATYDLRCFEWGKKVPTRPLITNKIAAHAIFSVLLLLGVGFEETTQYLSTFTANVASDPNSMLLVGGAILWSGLTVNSLAMFLQVFGQQAIGPTKAQTIYASQPMWAALLSFVFLGETVGTQGLLGGAAFVAALVIAATSEPEPSTTEG